MSNNMNITNETDYPTAPLEEEHQRSQDHGRRSCCSAGSGFVLSEGVIRAIFLLLGVGILIPWNAFVSAKSYFTSRFCQSGHDILNFEQYFGLAWNFASVISLGLIIVGQSFSDYWNKKNDQSLSSNAGERNNNVVHPATNIDLVNEPRLENETNPLGTRSGIIDDDDRPSNSSSVCEKNNSFYTVMVPLGLYTVVFFIQALLVTITDISPSKFLIITLISLALCGTCGAIATAGIVSTAGFFPSHIGINPFFSGQALGGLVVSIANFAAVAIGDDTDDYFEEHCGLSGNHIDKTVLANYVSRLSFATKRRLLDNDSGSSCSSYKNLDWAVLSYFFAGCVILLFCLVGYHKVHQYQTMRHRHVYETVHESHGDHREMNSSDGSHGDETGDNSPRIGLEMNDRIRQRQQMQSSDDENDENQIEQDTFEDEREEDTDSDGSKSFVAIIKGPATCIFLTFTITLSLFPSWISELKSSHECENRYRLDNDLYVPFSFVFFNMGDLLGRLISGYIPVNRIPNLSRKLVLCAMLRVLFLPAFLLCNTTLGSESSIVIRNDFFSLLVQLLFAVSNGVLISTSFMWSPQLLGTASTLQERASEIMTFSVFFGLLSGSFLAFPFLQYAAQLLK